VPGSIVYDRTKTVIKRHVVPRAAVPLHPEAAPFAEHYGFVIDVLAAYRPTGKGRVERQVLIGREHVLAARSFDSIAELDAAFLDWLPIRRAQVHRTHGVWGSRTSHMELTSGDRSSPAVGHDHRRVAAAAVPDLSPDAEAGLAAGTQHIRQGRRVVGVAARGRGAPAHQPETLHGLG
jgi:hypothetical protein